VEGKQLTRGREMTEVKFVYTGYINIADTENDIMEAAIEHVRAEYGSQVADFAEFTIAGQCEHDICDCNIEGESNE
jgi:hypothetical protein